MSCLSACVGFSVTYILHTFHPGFLVWGRGLGWSRNILDKCWPFQWQGEGKEPSARIPHQPASVCHLCGLTQSSEVHYFKEMGGTDTNLPPQSAVQSQHLSAEAKPRPAGPERLPALTVCRYVLCALSPLPGTAWHR